jgi:hypothetical protein
MKGLQYNYEFAIQAFINFYLQLVLAGLLQFRNGSTLTL